MKIERLALAIATVALATTLSWDRGPRIGGTAEAQFAKLCAAAGDAVKGAFDDCEARGVKMGQCLKEVGKAGLEKLKKAGKMLKSFWEWLKGVPAKLLEWRKQLDEYLGAKILGAWDWLKEKAVAIKNWYVRAAEEQSAAIAKNPAVQKLKAAFHELWEAIKGFSMKSPVQTGKRIIAGFRAASSALGEVMSSSLSKLGQLAKSAYDGASKFFSETKAKLEAKIKSFEKQAKDGVNKKISDFWNGAKDRAIALGKKALGALVKRLLSTKPGRGKPAAAEKKSIATEIAKFVAKKAEPLVKEALKVVVGVAKKILSVIFGGAATTGDQMCLLVAPAGGPFAPLVKAVCGCVVGLMSNVIRDMVLKFISDKFVQPLVEKGLTKVLDPWANELLGTFDGDLRRIADSLSGSADEVKAKLQGLGDVAKAFVPATVMQTVEKGAVVGIQKAAAAAKVCLDKRKKAGFFATVDCFLAAGKAGLNAAASEVAAELLRQLFKAGGGGIKNMYVRLKKRLLGELGKVGVKPPPEFVQLIETAGKDGLTALAKEGVKCLKNLGGSGKLGARVKATFSCVVGATKGAAGTAMLSAVKGLLKTVTDRIKGGAKGPVKTALDAVNKKVASLGLSFRLPAQEIANGVGKGAAAFAGAAKKCIDALKSLGIEPLKTMGTCVAGAAKAGAATAALEALKASLSSLVKAITSGAKRTALPLLEQLNTKLSALGVDASFAADAIEGGIVRGARTFGAAAQKCVTAIKRIEISALSGAVTCIGAAAAKTVAPAKKTATKKR